jgi:hypothetical protein
LTSNPNELIRYGYLQPRLALSSGEPALDPDLAQKNIPYYKQVFKPELGKTAVWLHSTKGDQVIAVVWGAITRVIYQGMSVDDSVAALQTDIRAIIPAK